MPGTSGPADVRWGRPSRSSIARRCRWVRRRSFRCPARATTAVKNPGLRRGRHPVDQDVAVTLRDGTTIYVDVYRPADVAEDAPLPAIVAWCWYGKRPGDDRTRSGRPTAWRPVPTPRWSSSRAPDPAYWCRRGYAVVNADRVAPATPRGARGPVGQADGEDGHDAIEWIAAQPWSNGEGRHVRQRRARHGSGSSPPSSPSTSPVSRRGRGPRTCTGRSSPRTASRPRVHELRGEHRAQRRLVSSRLPGDVREYPTMNAYWRSKVPASRT